MGLGLILLSASITYGAVDLEARDPLDITHSALHSVVRGFLNGSQVRRNYGSPGLASCNGGLFRGNLFFGLIPFFPTARKWHRNGIKKPRSQRYESLKGVSVCAESQKSVCVWLQLHGQGLSCSLTVLRFAWTSCCARPVIKLYLAFTGPRCNLPPESSLSDHLPCSPRAFQGKGWSCLCTRYLVSLPFHFDHPYDLDLMQCQAWRGQLPFLC